MKPSYTKAAKTDVLVLGAGAAGLRAAIEAHQLGVEVCIVSMFKAGYGSNTAISRGGFAAANSTFDEEDSPQIHYRDTIRGGYQVNRPFLAHLLTEKVWSEVDALEAMGVHFLKDTSGKYLRVARGGHSQTRRLSTEKNSGMNFITPLLKYMKKLNIKKLGGLKVVSLLKKDSRICGALLIDRKGEWFAVEAKSVVLATGGGGAIYPKTTNVPYMAGDGYALAYRAGLSIQDMEFVQFLVRHSKEPGVPKRFPPCELLLLKGAVLQNSKGENLFELPDSPTILTRDAISQTVARGILNDENLNNFVYLDLSTMDKKERDLLNVASGKKVKIQTACHFFMGGVRVNEDLSTAIAGFYVAGEVMGGVHGANRLGGNALAETFVFGALAGSHAAQFAKKSGQASPFQKSMVHHATDALIVHLSGSSEGATSEMGLVKINLQLKDLMGAHAGVIRDRRSIEQGINLLEKLKEDFSRLPYPKLRDVWHLSELDNKLTVCEMILKSARKREETRGAHYRTDFPETDNQHFMVNMCVARSKKGQMQVCALEV